MSCIVLRCYLRDVHAEQSQSVWPGLLSIPTLGNISWSRTTRVQRTLVQKLNCKRILRGCDALWPGFPACFFRRRIHLEQIKCYDCFFLSTCSKHHKRIVKCTMMKKNSFSRKFLSIRSNIISTQQVHRYIRGNNVYNIQSYYALTLFSFIIFIFNSPLSNLKKLLGRICSTTLYILLQVHIHSSSSLKKKHFKTFLCILSIYE